MPPACAHCASGSVPRWRANTREWVHYWQVAGRFSTTLCVERKPPPVAAAAEVPKDG